jgi:hypothetical protein
VAKQTDEPVPQWAVEPFKRFRTYVQEEGQLLTLAAEGIHMLVARVPLAEALARLDKAASRELAGASPKDERKYLREVRERAKLAREEVDKDFPLLHGHSLVSLWGALETLVEEVVLAWLSHRPKLLDDPRLSAVRVTVSEFQRMKKRERLEHLIEQFPKKPGVGSGFPRFEDLLDLVLLSGPLDDNLRRTLIEVHQVRNVYAHRVGVADRKLIEACPWRKDWKVGQPVLIGSNEYGRYLNALADYVVELVRRSGRQFGREIDPGE